MHCRHVYFGGTADNGYARLLGPFIEDKTALERITLLEGPPFAMEIANMRDRFRTVSFDNVLRKQKLENITRKVSVSIKPQVASSINYATAATKTSGLPTMTSAPSVNPASNGAKKNEEPEILRNRHGQRVDPGPSPTLPL